MPSPCEYLSAAEARRIVEDELNASVIASLMEQYHDLSLPCPDEDRRSLSAAIREMCSYLMRRSGEVLLELDGNLDEMEAACFTLRALNGLRSEILRQSAVRTKLYLEMSLELEGDYSYFYQVLVMHELGLLPQLSEQEKGKIERTLNDQEVRIFQRMATIYHRSGYEDFYHRLVEDALLVLRNRIQRDVVDWCGDFPDSQAHIALAS